MRTELYGHEIEYETQEELSEFIKKIRANQVPKHLRKKFASKVELVPQSESALTEVLDPKIEDVVEELTEAELLDRQGNLIIFPIDQPQILKLEGEEMNQEVPEFTVDAEGNPVLTNPEAAVTEAPELTTKTEDVKPSQKQLKRK